MTAPALAASGARARAERVVGGMQSARAMSTGPATLSEFGLRRVLTVLCVTEIVSWGVLYYAFPVSPRASRPTPAGRSPTITAAFSTGLVVSALSASGRGGGSTGSVHTR